MILAARGSFILMTYPTPMDSVWMAIDINMFWNGIVMEASFLSKMYWPRVNIHRGTIPTESIVTYIDVVIAVDQRLT